MNKFILSLALLLSTLTYAETSHKVEGPFHHESKMPFSLKSNLDGVCKYLNFDRSLKNSGVKSYGWINLDDGSDFKYKVVREKAIVLDADGNMVELKKSKIIDSLICIND